MRVWSSSVLLHKPGSSYCRRNRRCRGNENHWCKYSISNSYDISVAFKILHWLIFYDYWSLNSTLKWFVGSFWCSGIHTRWEEQYVQVHWCHPPHGRDEVQTETSGRTGWSWRHLWLVFYVQGQTSSTSVPCLVMITTMLCLKFVVFLVHLLLILMKKCYVFPEAERVAFLLGVNAGDLLKALLKPKIKVGTEVVTQGRNKDQVS